MSDSLVFMMGQYEARFPIDRRYARNHMWAQDQGAEIRFGFSTYAVRLLQDVYFLEWSVEAPSPLTEKQQIGFIESKKAESDLFSPATGLLARFNDKLLADPTAINLDTYGAGWLFEMQAESPPLLTAAEYIVHLEAVWEVTQRTIKGQMNEVD
jgi:glycine cleavage system H protein